MLCHIRGIPLKYEILFFFRLKSIFVCKVDMECRATLHVSYYCSLPAIIYKCKDTTWSIYLDMDYHSTWSVETQYPHSVISRLI